MARLPAGATPLVGRELERQQLQALLARTLEGEGSFALISGEAGIGKTTLVNELAGDGERRGALVLRGACYDLDLPAPYSLWLDLARRYVPDSDLPQPPAALVDPSALQALGGSGELHEAVAGFLADVARRRATILVLEDLHWADDASLDLLRVVARQVHSLPVLLVVTYRDVELTPSHPLYRRLPLLVREARPARLPLRPLPTAAVSELVHAHYASLPPADAERLVAYLDRYAEGNPFFIEELLTMLEYERLLWLDGDTWRAGELATVQVPALVRQVVEARIARLSEPTRELLQVAAVIGVDVPFKLWQAVSGAEDEALANAIQEATVAQVIEEAAGADTLQFRHALIREVLYRTLNLLHRRRWHLRAGEALAAGRQPDPSAVAYHFVHAGDDRAADWLIQAGQRAARAFALSATIANYERALSILEPPDSRTADRTWLLCALGEAHRFTDTVKAIDYLAQAIDLANKLNDPALQALANWASARVRGFRDELVLDDLRDAAARYAGLTEREQARILETPLRYVVSAATLSQDLANYGMFAEAERHARLFLERSSALASRSEYIEFGNAHFGLALAHAALGKPDSARAAFARSRDYYQETDNYQMTSNSYYWELNTLLQVYFADDPAERASMQQAEVAANLRSEFVQTSGSAEMALTTDTAILDGHWEQCRRSATARLNVMASKVPSARKLAELDRLQGHRDQAWAHIHSIMPDGPETSPGRRFFLHRQEAQWIAAELALDAGDFDLASEWIAAAERWFDWSGRISYRSMPHLLRARLHEEQGELDLAREHAERALSLAGNPRQPLLLLAAHRALARLDVESGQLDRAKEHARDAMALAEACAAPYETALTQVVWAGVFSKASEIESARDALENARATCKRLMARPLLERIEQAMEALGQRPEAATAGSSEKLSARELEVLRAAARGLTDAQIAEELFISHRTVGGHLRSVYGKLGVNSRTSAVAIARELGLL